MKKSLISAFALTCALTATAASAAPFSTTITQILTQNGQNLEFQFDMLPPSNGTGGTLTIASGSSNNSPNNDGLDITGLDEVFQVFIESMTFGDPFSCTGNFGVTQIPGANIIDTFNCQFSLDIPLNASLLDTALFGNEITINVDFSPFASHLDHEDEVIVTLAYEAAMAPMPVSSPASLALLGFGLVGLGAARRRAR